MNTDLADRLERHEELGNAENARLIGGEISDQGNVVLICSQPEFSTGLNYACRVRTTEAEASALIEQVIDWFRKRSLKPHIRVSPLTRPAQMANLLVAHGFEKTEAETQMLLTGDDREPPANPRVNVELIGLDRVEQWATIQNIAFDGSGWYSPAARALHAGIIGAGGRPYLASLDGEPAGAAMLERFEDVWGIYGVATLPEARGHGVATAIMRRVIQDAHRIADGPLCLQAETDSATLRWYERLGFTVMYDRTGWTLGGK